MWDFGDGSTASGVTATHTYSDAGAYTITLTVTDNDGSTNQLRQAFNLIVPSPPADGVPTASFTLSFNTGQDALEVSVDASTSADADGNIINYAWDFGDGSTTSGVTATHTYSDAGRYVITLTITDDAGNISQVSRILNLVSPPEPTNRPPIALIVATPSIVGIPLTVRFDATNSLDFDGTVVGYTWDFGDGQTATGATVDHTFASEGSYVIELEVTDDDGDTGRSSLRLNLIDLDPPNPPDVPTNQAPGATFTASPANGTRPLEVTFDASASTDSDGTIVSYDWDFGDASGSASATGITTSYTFDAAGTYAVTLTVTDDDGASASNSQTVVVSEPVADNQAPEALFTSTPNTGQAPLTVMFNASASTDEDGSITRYEWLLGDGISRTGRTLEYTYDSPGSYTVTLTVTDDDNASSQAESVITVLAPDTPMPDPTPDPPDPPTPSNVAPSASFAATPASGDAPLTVSFDASVSSDSDGTIIAYVWAFGDGATGAGETIEHIYDDPGTYTARLTVADDDGATSTSTVTITVLGAVNQPPVAEFTASATGGSAPLVVNFDASASQDSDGSIDSYTWDFGDGTTGTGVMTNHTYDAAGTYTVRLTIMDDDGASVEVTLELTIDAPATPINQPPTVSIEATPASGDSPLTVIFTATAQDPDGDSLSYDWDFGDGTTLEDTTTTQTHTYTVAGTYTATVTADDGQGNSVDVGITIIVRNPTSTLQYEGRWRWFANAILTDEVFAGYVDINQTDADNPNARNIELGPWYWCGETLDNCPSTPTGTGVIADFSALGDFQLGVSFVIGTSDVHLSVLDTDDAIGNEFGGPSIQGTGLWIDENGQQILVAFGMRRLDEGESLFEVQP